MLKQQWSLIRSLSLLACGNKLSDPASGYFTIQSENGTPYWSGPMQSFRELIDSGYVQKEQISVHGFASEVIYGISEKGKAALYDLTADWQQVLQHSVILRPYPGSSKNFSITIGEIQYWWMDSPYYDSNTYLYIENGQRRGIALKKDNAALYRNGLFPDTSTNAFGKRKVSNPYIFLAHLEVNLPFHQKTEEVG